MLDLADQALAEAYAAANYNRVILENRTYLGPDGIRALSEWRRKELELKTELDRRERTVAAAE